MHTSPQLPIFQAPVEAPKYPTFLFVKYMGSKREIADWVATEIEGALGSRSSTVLDLMAGTSAVGYALSSRHRIIANDIQHYSRVLAESLLKTSCAVPPEDAIWRLLEPFFQQNQKTLRRFLSVHVECETQLLKTSVVTKSSLKEYEKFQAEYPHAGDFKHSSIFNGLGDRFKKLVTDRKQNPSAIPYCLFTIYFANAYFGMQQAIDIDSIRFAIDCVFPEASELRSLALACLMHSASYSTPGPGHFAQFRALNSIAVCQDILRYRNRSIKDYFIKKWAEFRTQFRRPSRQDNICDTLDYARALEKYLPIADLVYVDPPYSFVHYSRFYHALETLVRYDYPNSEFYGRYRTDRHQSPFCIRNQVADALESIVQPVSDLKRVLVFSYSNTGMITLEELVSLCGRGFKRVTVKKNDYLHATMGRRGDKNREVEETLIICQP